MGRTQIYLGQEELELLERAAAQTGAAAVRPPVKVVDTTVAVDHLRGLAAVLSPTASLATTGASTTPTT